MEDYPSGMRSSVQSRVQIPPHTNVRSEQSDKQTGKLCMLFSFALYFPMNVLF